MLKKAKIKGKIVGEYDTETNTFTKKVLKSKHLFQKADAWGIDTELLDKLEEKDATIQVIDQEEPHTYTTTAENWKNTGFVKEFGEHRQQTFLPLRYFE